MPFYHPPASGAHARDSSSGTADVKTLTPPAGATACVLCVETTSARVTFDGSTPSATNGLVVPSGANPLVLDVRPGAGIKWASTAAAASILNVLWLIHN